MCVCDLWHLITYVEFPSVPAMCQEHRVATLRAAANFEEFSISVSMRLIGIL